MMVQLFNIYLTSKFNIDFTYLIYSKLSCTLFWYQVQFLYMLCCVFPFSNLLWHVLISHVCYCSSYNKGWDNCLCFTLFKIRITILFSICFLYKHECNCGVESVHYVFSFYLVFGRVSFVYESLFIALI